MYEIAVLVIIILAAVVSIKWRVRPDDFTGYWRAVKGGITVGEHEVIAGEKTLVVDGVAGRTGFLRRLCVGRRCGHLDLLGRHISWPGGEKWIREGVYQCRSCIA
ncbi:MAG: hypothetical protein KGL39_23955 [Patescibacteria group bacterium]|nr:hypothetical protein [Patescibacteria group bacterium]